MIRASWAIIVLTAVVSVKALNNGLAMTPPMGFNAWQAFGCQTDCVNFPDTCISEKLFKSIADEMVAGGYLAAGYQYLNIDDCWMANERDANGRLQADPVRFPSGIKGLVDYIHSKGLKFGIYSDYGNWTCGGYPGTPDDYLQIDATAFAEWGVDYFKFDGCYTEAEDMPNGYITMGTYLNATGRPIVYSCSWPAYWTYQGLDPDYQAIAKTCNLWRNWDDVYDDWVSIEDIFTYYAVNQDELTAVAGPGHWNDPDMLVGGNQPGITTCEFEVQMGLWAILAAPLLISTDIRKIDQAYKDIYLNAEVIKLNQEVLGIQGRLIMKSGDLSVWTKQINPVHHSDKDYYSLGVAILNNGTAVTSVDIPLDSIGLTFTGGYGLQDLFVPDNQRLLYPTDSITATVQPHGIKLYRVEVLKC
ncbi:hypothetical protein CHUAL_008624 [Chamberlinius hualienensis]